MSILSKFLLKRGVVNADDLTPEEKVTFNNWKMILDGGIELTTKQIKEFCEQQVGIIESKWRMFDMDEDKKAGMIPYHSVYKTIIQAIDAPSGERSKLEEYLNQLLNK